MAKKILRTLCAILILSMCATIIPFYASAAQTESFLFGDVDGDNNVTASDALSVLCVSVKKYEFDDKQTLIADVNGDKAITGADALAVLQFAVELINAFDVGVSGEYTAPELSFTPVAAADYWCYNQLNTLEKNIYNTVYNNLTIANTNDFAVVRNPSADVITLQASMQKAFTAVVYDHPELFWAKTSFGYSSSGNTVYMRYGAQYIYDTSTLEAKKVTLDNKINEIFNQVLTPNMTEGEIALALHDWIVNNTKYYDEAAEGNNPQNPTYYPAWSAYEALVNGRAVCEGLSKAYQLLLYRAGILATVALSSDHMWNYVRLDGEWYITDITWADGNFENKVTYDNPNGYYHFYNQTTSVMNQSHTLCPDIEDMTEQQILDSRLNFNFNLPECTSIDCNYFYQNNLVFESQSDFADKAPEIIANVKNSGKSIVQFMIKDVFFTSATEPYDYLTSDVVSEANYLINSYSNKITKYSVSIMSGACGFIVIC